jgi:transposase-like protein
MEERIIRRYSACFRQQVVADLENGRFGSIEEARAHYGIGGKGTIQKWLRRYGKNHLQAKVVRVEKPDEADQIRQFKRQVAQLQQALGKTQAENLLHAEYLKLACEEMGTDVESFKKKAAGGPFGPPGKPGQ